jgi:anthranilate phosphoribosyltransferase
MEEIMRGDATNAQIAAFLTALRMKGETIDEITACAAVMRERCTKLPHNSDVLEIVGTGGDEAYTFNISTVSAFVVAAAGVAVAKHGNRSVSSKCGAADFLEAVGAKLDLSAQESAEVLEKTGICFMFAPNYHASMKYAAPVRKEMGSRTIFNILGPLANPAGPSFQLLGVYDKNLVLPLAHVLSNLGLRRAMVVHGDDGLDEITLCTTTTVCESTMAASNPLRLTRATMVFRYARRRNLSAGDGLKTQRLRALFFREKRAPARRGAAQQCGLPLYGGQGGEYSKSRRPCRFDD